MNTEITGTREKIAGEVFYDADCELCSNGVKRWGHLFAARGFRWVPLQKPGAADRLGADGQSMRTEMKLLQRDGSVVGGMEAWVILFRSVWWLRPMGSLMSLPGFRWLFALAYRGIARNRHCLNGHCAIARRSGTVVGLLEAGVMTAVLVATGALLWRMPAWMLMWALAFILFAGCKWTSFRDAIKRGRRPGRKRILAYLFAWPGMDANTFLDSKARPVVEPAIRWGWGIVNMAFGASLVWLAVPRLIDAHPLIAGWAGMWGVVLMLHFGLFLLLAIGWQQAEIAATPLMRTPLRSTSVVEFWGDRWNTAFHELAHRFTFRPLTRIAGARTATVLVFVISGLVHEVVISLPTRAGFGLPTLYFLVQGTGVLFERTRLARRIGLGRGPRGWLFTVVVTSGPAVLLFHPPFIHNVILPFMQALGG